MNDEPIDIILANLHSGQN